MFTDTLLEPVSRNPPFFFFFQAYISILKTDIQQLWDQTYTFENNFRLPRVSIRFSDPGPKLASNTVPCLSTKRRHWARGAAATRPSLTERGPVQTHQCTQGIVTRCRGGNTCSIPRGRNVFISLFLFFIYFVVVFFFLQMSPFGAMYALKCTAGRIAQSRASSGFNGQPVSQGPGGFCYLDSWHSLLRHVQMWPWKETKQNGLGFYWTLSLRCPQVWSRRFQWTAFFLF